MLIDIDSTPLVSLESGDAMAIGEKDFRELSKEVASMRGALKVVGTLGTIAIVGAFGWCWHLGNKVTAIEQQLADGGNTRLVTQLKNPQSSEQLKASLNTVIAQVQTAKVEGKPPNSEKVQALTTALSQVISKDPDMPEAWNAAAELISYKTENAKPDVGSLPRCDLAALKPEARQKTFPDGSVFMIFGYYASHCALYLEDVPEMHVNPNELKNLHIEISGGGGDITFPIYLTDGIAVYHGGPIRNSSGFVLQDCVLDFNVNDIPPSEGAKDLLRAALENPALIDTSVGATKIPATHS